MWWFPSGYNTITSKESNLILIIHFQSCYKYTFYLPRIWLAVELLDCAGYCKCYLEVVPKHTIYLVFASFVAIYNAVNTNLARVAQIFRSPASGLDGAILLWFELYSSARLNYTKTINLIIWMGRLLISLEMTFKQRSIGRTTESLSFIEKPIFPLLLSYGGDYLISEIICLCNGYIIRIYTGMS